MTYVYIYLGSGHLYLSQGVGPDYRGHETFQRIFRGHEIFPSFQKGHETFQRIFRGHENFQLSFMGHETKCGVGLYTFWCEHSY